VSVCQSFRHSANTCVTLSVIPSVVLIGREWTLVAVQSDQKVIAFLAHAVHPLFVPFALEAAIHGFVHSLAGVQVDAVAMPRTADTLTSVQVFDVSGVQWSSVVYAPQVVRSDSGPQTDRQTGTGADHTVKVFREISRWTGRRKA